MPVLKIKTRDGHISNLNVAELLEIDGKAYNDSPGDGVLERIAVLEGRITAIENIFTTQEVEG